MDIRTAQRIDALLANEVFPTFVKSSDFNDTMELKLDELDRLTATESKQAIEKCCFEIAAITINFLESGVLKP